MTVINVQAHLYAYTYIDNGHSPFLVIPCLHK